MYMKDLRHGDIIVMEKKMSKSYSDCLVNMVFDMSGVEITIKLDNKTTTVPILHFCFYLSFFKNSAP